jgi:hypothetical protein
MNSTAPAPLDRGLRAPAEGVTPKARRELPAMEFCIGHFEHAIEMVLI